MLNKKKNVDFYLSKGLSFSMAEYFANGRKKIIKVVPNDNFTLTLSFDNGEHRIYDCKPLLKPGTAFESLREIDNFKRVYIDNANCIAWDIDPTIDSNKNWNNKVDLCPDKCYVDSIPIREN